MNSSHDDPRHQNVMFDTSSIDVYRRNYAAALQAAIEGVSNEAVSLVCDRVSQAADEGKRILVVGNGGSAAIAEHLCCDWTKGTSSPGAPVIDTRSLTANSSLYSAIANDYGFEHVFDTQIGFFGAPGDVLIAISSSGNSKNVLNAVLAAKDLGMFVAGFTGFSGGELAGMADASVHVATNNYGIVEDAHQAIMHIIAQFIASRRDQAHR